MGIKYVISENGMIPKAHEVPRYQTIFKDDNRKLYKALKKRYSNPNSNAVTHYQNESEQEENDNE